ncbi:hypothetical protein [Flavobacterium sp. N1994]|uniref:hypothetical protein n=1 Tax=Flavobacterium sp. N1994 TaxID=2986827 RepID=UPI00222296A7|nr:hypothetical protein [Flavobacterium sp. N1994]
MKKALIIWYSFLAILLLMTSCKSVKNVPIKEITKDSITVVSKDTLLTVAKDSSQTVADLGIEDGKIVIKKINNSRTGHKLKAPKVTVKDNVLTVDCEKEAEELFFSWKEKFIKSYSQKEIPITTNILTWWQWTQIYIGRIALGAFFLWLLLLFFNYKKI